MSTTGHSSSSAGNWGVRQIARKKNAKTKGYFQPKKIPAHVPVKREPPGAQTVQWCFRSFDKYQWYDRSHDPPCFTNVADHLKSYEQMTWADVMNRDHRVPVARLIAKAQQRLSQHPQGDVDHLLRLQFTSKQRLWGIKNGDIFHVIWWDPEHSICPSPKRHT